MKRRIWFLLLSCILVLTACNSSATPTSPEAETPVNKKIVYASFYPIYDFTYRIVKDKMDVRLIIPSGAEPHDYEVGAKTLSDMSDADSVLLLGLDFEPWSEKLDETTKSKTAFIGESARPIEYEDGEFCEICGHSHGKDHDHEHGLHDPHVWMDPTRAKDMSKAILDEMIKIDPDNKEFYTENYEQLAAQFDELDKKLQEVAKKHHDVHKDIIVSHNAFTYLTDTYNIHFDSISGLSPAAEPSLQAIADLVDEIKEHEIKYIFFEELSNSKIIESIAKETDAKVDLLYTIEGMTEDEMKRGDDYFSKMNQNIEKIDLALQ